MVIGRLHLLAIPPSVPDAHGFPRCRPFADRLQFQKKKSSLSSYMPATDPRHSELNFSLFGSAKKRNTIYYLRRDSPPCR